MQQMVYYGQLTDDVDDVPEALMKHYGATTRYNLRISSPDKEQEADSPQLSLTGSLSPKCERLEGLAFLHTPTTEDEVKTITHWVILDLTEKVHSSSSVSYHL